MLCSAAGEKSVSLKLGVILAVLFQFHEMWRPVCERVSEPVSLKLACKSAPAGAALPAEAPPACLPSDLHCDMDPLHYWRAVGLHKMGKWCFLNVFPPQSLRF